MVLKLTLDKALKDLGIRADVVTSDIGTAKTQPADVIVTSAELARLLSDRGIPVISIKNYVDKEEMKTKLSEALGLR